MIRHGVLDIHQDTLTNTIACNQSWWQDPQTVMLRQTANLSRRQCDKARVFRHLSEQMTLPTFCQSYCLLMRRYLWRYFCFRISHIHHKSHGRCFPLMELYVINPLVLLFTSALQPMCIMISWCLLITPTVHPSLSLSLCLLQASVLQADRWVCCSDRASQEWNRPGL